MKIGIDARFLTDEYIGIGRYSHCILKAIAQVDTENEYLVFKSPKYPEKIIDQANFREVVIRPAPLSPGTLTTFGRTLKAEKLDVFHSHFYITPLVKSYKQVVTVHDITGLLFPGFYAGRNYIFEKLALWFHQFAIPHAIRQSDAIITPSESTKKSILKVVPDKPGEAIDVIHYGIEPHFRRPDEQAIAQGKKTYGLPDRYFVYVGNTKPHKNLVGLTTAFSMLLESSPRYHDIKLIIAGQQDRFFPAVKEHVASLAHGDKVIYWGYASDRDLLVLYPGALAFVFPGLLEGFGLPVLEALACGSPVITSTASSIPEVVGDAGILLGPGDTRGFAEAMKRVADDGELREALASKGMERARIFSWRKAALQTIAVYDRL